MALEKAHQTVYNKMPLCLLMFSTNGTDVRLVERPEILLHISARIENNFNEDKIASYISKYRFLNSVAEDKLEDLIISRFVAVHTKYAILSHTWLQGTTGEVIYTHWRLGRVDKCGAGYAKLASFCRVAAKEYGLTLAWMDTLCINKDSSAELDESIRSMYKWYASAEICIAYLSETTAVGSIHTDSWFTRGWTLQELIAPSRIKFHDANWTKIAPGSDDKENTTVLAEIFRATSITKDELQMKQEGRLLQIPISRRMEWAAHRRVTREEDTAYSLMGIFDVSFATAYGEGVERASVRLVREIVISCDVGVLDILNWGCPRPRPGIGIGALTIRANSTLIPASPKAYAWRAKDIKWYPPATPVSLTQMGLSVSVLMMPALPVNKNEPASTPFAPQGNYSATTTIDVLPGIFNILDLALVFGPSMILASPREQRRDVVVVGVLNFMETPDAVELPANGLCYALILRMILGPQRQSTNKEFEKISAGHTTFNLKCHKGNTFLIPKKKLSRHGMMLRTLHL